MRLDIDIAIKETYESGQTLSFISKIINNNLVYSEDKLLLYINAESIDNPVHSIYVKAYPKHDASYVKQLLRSKDNLNKIYESIDTDSIMHKAIMSYKGLRLTKSDPVITTIVFIISQFNNINRIRGIIDKLYSYGKVVKLNSKSYRLFPDLYTLEKISIERLREIGLGYRAPYLYNAVRYMLYNLDMYSLEHKSYEYIKDALMDIYGIGDKVSDCIALFGYGKTEAFPIDTWIKRAIERLYFNNERLKISKIKEFAYSRWGRYAGYAQQYLYHLSRMTKLSI
ncbi:MAG: 8-oxoguanine DNA glycosylase [Candidatus Micrarchaeota archaeon]|nr:MAG: 8-oxoguanine DNA glycosylase [Candidatus Micrarchaeota archaeon]